VLIFGAITAFFILRRLNYERKWATLNEYGNKEKVERDPPSIVPAIVFAVVGFVLIIGTGGIREIPAGHVGVITSFGRVTEGTLPSGLTYVMPVVNQVVILDTRVQSYEFTDLQGATSDTQAVTLSGSVNYRIDGATAWKLYRDVGEDFAVRVFQRPADTALKTITPRYTATDIIGKRDEIASLATQLLRPSVEQYGISVEAFYVSNIGLNQAFLNAVEAKQIANQQVLTQKQITAQKEEQKKQAKIDAEGRADAARAAANGEADAIRSLADAQADANKLLNNSLTPELIQYTLINKLSPTIKTMILPDGQNFILDPKALLGQ